MGFVIWLISLIGAFIWPLPFRDTINWFSPLAGYAVTVTYMQAFFIIQLKILFLNRFSVLELDAAAEYEKKEAKERLVNQITMSILMPLVVWLIHFIVYKVAT